MDSTLLAVAALEGVGRDGEDQQEYAQGSPGDADQQAILHRLHIDHEQQKEEGEPDKEDLGKCRVFKMLVHLCYTPFHSHTPLWTESSTVVCAGRA